jgi:lactoylglutathione lyase
MQRLLGASRRVGTAPARSFRVLGLQQVAIGGLDKSRLSGLWEGLLGVPRIGQFASEKENVDEDILLLGRGVAAVELDLMQPLDADKAPKVHSPPLNHIGLWVIRRPQRLFATGRWFGDHGLAGPGVPT